MQTAVAYARFSSDNQREESIDAQIRAIKDYCAQNDIELLKIYSDEAMTGTNDDRPQFQKMLEEVENIDYVIVHKLDRFARNRYDSAVNKRKLRDKGARVKSVLEQFDDSPESVMLESIIEGMNEYYSLNLSREVKKGHRENALKAKHNGGRPPLGYDVDENLNYIINEDEAVIVRLIFKLYSDGYGYLKIIDILNSNGYRSKVGKEFGKNSLYEILRNEKYRGVYLYNRRKRMGNSYNNHKDNENKIRIEDAMPKIIDDTTWENVRDKREDNKRKGGSFRSKFVYLLSGKLQHDCGSIMTGTVKTNKKSDTPVYYYRCEDKDCSIKPKSIQVNNIEPFVINALTTYIFNPDSTFAKEMFNKVNSKDDVAEFELLKKRLDKIVREEDKITEAVVKGLLNDSLISKNKDLQEQKTAITIKINNLKSDHRSYTMDEINEYMQKYADLKDYDREAQKRVIDMFVYKVVLTEDRVRIILYPNPFGTRAQDNGDSHPDQFKRVSRKG